MRIRILPVSFALILLACWMSSAASKAHKKLFPGYPETVFGKGEIENAIKAMSGVSIVMSEREVALFERYIANATNYFEFGCGGSTILACKTGHPNLSVTSIDSSQEWIDTIMKNTHVADRAAKKLLHINVVNIGPVKKWGYPDQTVEASQGAWYLYSQAISVTGLKYDLVLVDGRFRVACALNAFISNPNASVLLHDFFGPDFHHNAYKVLLSVSDLVDRADSLAALRVKPHIHKDELRKLYATYINVPE